MAFFETKSTFLRDILKNITSCYYEFFCFSLSEFENFLLCQRINVTTCQNKKHCIQLVRVNWALYGQVLPPARLTILKKERSNL
jgi:hypothetical protein